MGSVGGAQVNAAAPQGSLAAVNGAGQALASLVRAAGPGVGGLLWAASEGLTSVSGHQFLCFSVICLGLLATQLLYLHVQLPGLDDH